MKITYLACLSVLLMFGLTIWQEKNSVKAKGTTKEPPAVSGLSTLQTTENKTVESNINSFKAFRQVRSCLNYEPEIVSLRGRLVRRTFINASNKRENVFLLELSKPICVNKDPNIMNSTFSKKMFRKFNLL